MAKITPEGRLQLEYLIGQLRLTPNSVIIVQTPENPGPLVDQLLAMPWPLPFTVPIITLKPGETIKTINRKELEEALEMMDKNPKMISLPIERGGHG